MYAPGGATERGPGDQPQAVELHGLDASVSLAQVRHLFQQADVPLLQLIAALDTSGGSQQGVALAILGSERAARAAVELFDGYPLGNAFLHVKRADSLPGSLINLLYSLEQASRSSAAAPESRVNAASAAVYLEQHQLLQRAEHRRQRQAQEAQQQAWDVAQQAQSQQNQQAQNQQAQQQQAAVAGRWSTFDALQRQAQQAQQMGNGHSSAYGHMPAQNGTSASSLPQHHQIEADLRHLQLDQQHRAQQAQQQQQQAAALPPPQPPPQQRTATMSWASAAAAAPSLAALAPRPPSTAAASLAAATVSSAAGSGSGPSSDDWQTASGSRGRTGRRGISLGSEYAGRAGSSVSSGSPAPANLDSGRHSEDKLSRPGGQDGASPEPTTKLWMGGIDGTASAETVRGIFGRFGPIYDYELQPATHEKGRTDQWGFVNYKRLGDASRAYEALVGEVIPELTGTRKLKLQFRPVDTRRPGGRR